MFRPSANKILVKPQKKDEKVTASGIVLPDSARDEKAMRGIVTSSQYSDVSVGEEILYSKYSYDEAEIDKETYHIVSLSGILGIF